MSGILHVTWFIQAEFKKMDKQECKNSKMKLVDGWFRFIICAFLIRRYRVFLGLNQYFAALDIGNGNMQWFAFHKQPPMSTDPPGGTHSLSLL